jgi:hypothetical protein
LKKLYICQLITLWLVIVVYSLAFEYTDDIKIVAIVTFVFTLVAFIFVFPLFTIIPFSTAASIAIIVVSAANVATVAFVVATTTTYTTSTIDTEFTTFLVIAIITIATIISGSFAVSAAKELKLFEHKVVIAMFLQIVLMDACFYGIYLLKL